MMSAIHIATTFMLRFQHNREIKKWEHFPPAATSPSLYLLLFQFLGTTSQRKFHTGDTPHYL
jgi:hypothetical protein